MAGAYSQDLRDRVVAYVNKGHSARAAASVFGVSASTAVKWIQRWKATGSVKAKHTSLYGRSKLLCHSEAILAKLQAGPDLTLSEIQVWLAETLQVKVGLTTIWLFLKRSGVKFKKNADRGRATPQRRRTFQKKMEIGSAMA